MIAKGFERCSRKFRTFLTKTPFKDNAEKDGWHVMRAEVFFWQAMFCLSFWGEIFGWMGKPIHGQDIPCDLFQGDTFYLNRQNKIDRRYKSLKQQNIFKFINNQSCKTVGAWTRLLFDGNQDIIADLKTQIVQDFLKRIPPEIFSKIVYRIAKNPCENRSGLPDFVIWNHEEFRMVEVKRVLETVRNSQESWIKWMLKENIPIEIVRVKGI